MFNNWKRANVNGKKTTEREWQLLPFPLHIMLVTVPLIHYTIIYISIIGNNSSCVEGNSCGNKASIVLGKRLTSCKGLSSGTGEPIEVVATKHFEMI